MKNNEIKTMDEALMAVEELRANDEDITIPMNELVMKCGWYSSCKEYHADLHLLRLQRFPVSCTSGNARRI